MLCVARRGRWGRETRGGAVLAFQGRSCKQRGIRVAIATYLCCCVTQVRALRRAAAKAPLRHRRVGETRECRASKASRASVRCEVRERYTKPLLILYRPF